MDRQPAIIRNGELLGPLGKNYLAYTNAIRLMISELYKNGGKAKRIPSIREIVEQEVGK